MIVRRLAANPTASARCVIEILRKKNNNRIINPRSENAKGRIRKSVAVTAV